jgi:hypothetical protein
MARSRPLITLFNSLIVMDEREHDEDDDLPEPIDTADIERVNTERDMQAPHWPN